MRMAEKQPHGGAAFVIPRGNTSGKEVSVPLKLPGLVKKRVSPRKRVHAGGDNAGTCRCGSCAVIR